MSASRHRLLGAILFAGIVSACASLLGVDDPTLGDPTTVAAEAGGPTGSDVSLGSKNDVGPKIRLESQAPTIEQGGGLDGEAVSKTMGQRMPALVGCVEDALKRNPNVKLEKVVLVMQVGTSGAVKTAGIEPKRVELTDWGGCIVQRAKKITFPPADSESEIQLPLVLGASMQ